jgi:hypothetical protein
MAKPAVLLLPQPLEDQHVRVDRAADGQDHRGDPGQGERRVDRRHRAQDDHDVQQHADERDQPAR